MTNQSRRRFLKATAAVGAAAGLNAAVLAQDEGDDQGEEPEEYILLGGETQGWIPYMLPGDDSAEDADSNPTLTLEAGTTYALLWRNVDGQPHNVAIQDQDGENLEVLQPLDVSADQFDQLNESDDCDDAEITLETSQPGDGNETDGGNESDGEETTAEGEGQLLGASETITEEGAVQGLQFTASDDMAQYICPVHPNTMVGDVELSEGDDGGEGGDGNETDGDENESS